MNRMVKCSECKYKIEGEPINMGKDENGNDYIVCTSCYGDICGLS